MQGRAGFLETPCQRGVEPRAADRHDESAEESRVDGRHEPDGFLRSRGHEGAQRLEDRGVGGLSRHDARLDSPRVAIQMRSNGGDERAEGRETPVVKEDGQKAPGELGHTDARRHGGEERLALCTFEAALGHVS